MSSFAVILDIDLTLNRYCLLSCTAQNVLQEETVGCKKQRFQNLCGLKSYNSKDLKAELLFNYKKMFMLKSLNTRFLIK